MKSPDFIINNPINPYEKVDILEIEEEIEDIFDIESEHSLAGRVVLNKKTSALLDEARNDEVSKERKIEILTKLKEMAVNSSSQSTTIDHKIFSKKKTKQEKEIIEKLFEENWLLIETQLKVARSTPNDFLGNGRVGEVFDIKAIENICFKFIHDFDAYNELNYQGQRIENRVEEEGSFLEELEEFEIAGVRTPGPYFYVSTDSIEGIAMEKLSAANFARIFEGHDSLPTSFDFDDYFERLERYFEALHEKGIVHKDIAARNLMIDIETGDPRVIDFGKSKRKADFMLEDKSFEEVVEDESIMLAKTKKDIKNKLKSLNNKK